MTGHGNMKTILHGNMKKHPAHGKCDIGMIALWKWPCKEQQKTLDGMPRWRSRQSREKGHLNHTPSQGHQQRRITGVSPTRHPNHRPEQKRRLRIAGIGPSVGVEDGEELRIVAKETFCCLVDSQKE